MTSNINNTNTSNKEQHFGGSSAEAQSDELELSTRLEKIANLLAKDEMSQPDTIMDKHIMAAAHRDMESAPRRSYHFSGWRKLSLPLYITAGFVFTVLAYNKLWPSQLRMAGGESVAPVIVELKLDESGVVNNDAAEKAMEQAKSTEAKIKRLEPLETPNRPTNHIDIQSIVKSEPINKRSNEIIPDLHSQKQNIYTGSHLSKSEFPEKEAWARKIIDQMRSGQFEKARKELRDFTEIYPDYPIKEQIKTLSQ
ncbi:MAG: hypothetical protein L3J46_11325 [Kangiellaceae bacterium]|nr:hypothetical protein [Kangiellaceae bacterium]